MLLSSPRAAVTTSSPLQRAIVGSTLIALSGVWVSLADVPPTVSAFFRCAYALPVLVWLARRESRRPVASVVSGRAAQRARTTGLIAGVCFAGDLILWHSAIDFVGAGLATVLAAGQVVIVPLASWALLGERPPRRVMVAIPPLLAGVAIISGVIGSGGYGSNPRLGALLGIGAAMGYSGFLLALRQANSTGDRAAGALRDATIGGVVGTLIATVATGHAVDLVPAWPSAGWLLALALGSQVVAWLLITGALPRLPAAVSSVVLTLQPLFSLLMAAVLLGERPSLLQLVGVVIVVAAVTHATGIRLRGRHRVPSPAV